MELKRLMILNMQDFINKKDQEFGTIMSKKVELWKLAFPQGKLKHRLLKWSVKRDLMFNYFKKMSLNNSVGFWMEVLKHLLICVDIQRFNKIVTSVKMVIQLRLQKTVVTLQFYLDFMMTGFLMILRTEMTMDGI